MASQIQPIDSKKAAFERTGGLRYLARQPILNTRQEVQAYELLFRDGVENAFRGDLETASRTIVDNAVIFGLDDLTGGMPAFVNCTAELLTGDLANVLPPEKTILEILETVEPTPEVVAACHKFKTQGFKIALDDFVWDPKFAPMVQLADYIKVDFLSTTAQERQLLFRELHSTSHAKLVAEKIETDEQYRQACTEGFTLFQGYYFCRPVMIEKRKIPANTLSHLEILHLLLADPLDFERLSPLVKSDAALTYRLLRLVNSAGYGIRQEVRSIQAALVIIGENSFRRIATLAIATELNAGRPAEILRMVLIRARFCELAAQLSGLDPTEQYLMGMFSLLPAMLQVPMEQLTPMLPLRKEICESLKGRDNPEHRLLAWLEALERGDWKGCEAIVRAHDLNDDKLYERYTEAVPWAWNILRSAV
jgi:EAL and modified HD-GYP domain-containing signal transduction protein